MVFILLYSSIFKGQILIIKRLQEELNTFITLKETKNSSLVPYKPFSSPPAAGLIPQTVVYNNKIRCAQFNFWLIILMT